MLDTLLIGIIFAIGAVMIAFGIGVGTSAATTTTTGFLVARVLLGLGIGVGWLAIAAWLWNSPISVLSRAIWFAPVGAAAFCTLFLAVQWINDVEIKTLPRLFAGTLDDPSIPDGAKIPAKAFKVFFGTSVAWFTTYPHTVLQMRGDQILVVDKDESGGLLISLLRLFNERDELMMRFENGDFWKAEGIRTSRPDKSTLVVYDKSDVEVLRVVFLNSAAVQLTGTFNHPPAPALIVKSDYLTMGTNKFQTMILGGSAISLSIAGATKR